MKKGLLIFLIIFISTAFFSCSKSNGIESSFQTTRTKLLDKLSVSTTKDNKEIAEKVIEGIKENDIDAIKNLFSEKSLSKIHDIDNQIKKLIELVNEIHINEYEIKNGFEGISREYGTTEELSRSCFIWYPNYEDCKYRMIISYCKINLKEPESEGIFSIKFYKQERYNDPIEIIEIEN